MWYHVIQGFPTFFAARTPLSGQSILSTPKKILTYILLYKRYKLLCDPRIFVPLDVQSRTPWGTSTPGWEPLM